MDPIVIAVIKELPPTKRELEIAQYLMLGMDQDDVAQRLRMRPGTLKNHLVHLREGLKVKNTTEAITILLKRGYLTTPSEKEIQNKFGRKSRKIFANGLVLALLEGDILSNEEGDIIGWIRGKEVIRQ
jgi:DNA-binding CsgD family transcriptional regulator